MKLEQIAEVIAVRRLALKDSETSVALEIGRPEKFPDGEDYFCPYRVVGLGNDKVRYAGGVDAVQALLLALKKVGAQLNTCAEHRDGRLYWLEADSRDLGLPLPDGMV